MNEYTPNMLFKQNLSKRSFLIVEQRKLGKNYCCLQVSTEYHKKNKMQIVERLNLKTRIISCPKNIGYTSFNMQRINNHIENKNLYIS